MTDLHRPRFHFTVPSGWINDPYGVTWHDGGYQLFFQYNPAAPRWAAHICWGQARSPDLVRWSPPTVALAPSGAEVGCWSGAVAMDGEQPTILYTSVGPGELDRGRIVVARGDSTFDGWATETVVLDAPPGLAVTHFRDPYVWWAGEDYRMIVGGGLEPATAAVFGFSSPDLRAWDFRGVLCSRPADDVESEWTGSVWECPQLFELDGAWVFVVSVAHAGSSRHVSYAVGDYDGRIFTPRCWHRLMYGDSPFAATTFLDAAGRRCALSWSREHRPVEGRVWAGALSTPLVLRRDGDRVLGTPHPDVDSLRTAISVESRRARVGREPVRLGPISTHSDVVLSGGLSPGSDLYVAVLQQDMPVLAVAVSHDTAALHRPGSRPESLPLGAGPDGRFELRLLLDASVVEVFTPVAAAGVRIAPASTAADLVLTASDGVVQVQQLTVHDMGG